MPDSEGAPTQREFHNGLSSHDDSSSAAYMWLTVIGVSVCVSALSVAALALRRRRQGHGSSGQRHSDHLSIRRCSQQLLRRRSVCGVATGASAGGELLGLPTPAGSAPLLDGASVVEPPSAMVPDATVLSNVGRRNSILDTMLPGRSSSRRNSILDTMMPALSRRSSTSSLVDKPAPMLAAHIGLAGTGHVVESPVLQETEVGRHHATSIAEATRWRASSAAASALAATNDAL
jgi:hypothetical protein